MAETDSISPRKVETTTVVVEKATATFTFSEEEVAALASLTGALAGTDEHTHLFGTFHNAFKKMTGDNYPYYKHYFDVCAVDDDISHTLTLRPRSE